MDLRPALQVQTVIKAMTDVVLPAVDPNNKLAQEQARLVIGMLHLVAQRQPLMYRYDRDELSRFLALADTLQAQAKDMPGAQAPLHALATVVENGEDVLDRAGAEPSELEMANFPSAREDRRAGRPPCMRKMPPISSNTSAPP